MSKRMHRHHDGPRRRSESPRIPIRAKTSAAPAIQKDCGRGSAAVTVPGAAAGEGTCAWAGAVETIAQASAIAITAWRSRRRIIAPLPGVVRVCADSHSARGEGAGIPVRSFSGVWGAGGFGCRRGPAGCSGWMVWGSGAGSCGGVARARFAVFLNVVVCQYVSVFGWCCASFVCCARGCLYLRRMLLGWCRFRCFVFSGCFAVWWVGV